MMFFQRLVFDPGMPCGLTFSRSLLRAAWSAALLLLAAPWAIAQTTFNYTGAVQPYTVPAGVRAIQIQAFGAGGGGGGSDNPGDGGAGGRGASISAIYRVVPGSVLNVTVGGGGGGAAGPAVNCSASGGPGGIAGGIGGYAGGPGGNRGCNGYSGAGGGGGAASVVTTQAGAVLLIAGGGGGGQGGALNLAGRDGLGNYSAAGTSSYLGPVTNFSGPLPVNSTYCTEEDAGGCNFSGTMEVWFGAQSNWAVAPASNGAPCSTGVFGDPAGGVVKACYYRPYAGSWTPPPKTGTAGSSPGGSDGGGGGGGGGGCLSGAGGAANPDGSGPNNTVQASGGSSCAVGNLPFDGPGAAVSATGGLGGAGGPGSASPGQPGAAGSVVITYPQLTLTQSQPSPALAVGVNSVYTLTVTNTNTSGIKAYSARVVDQLPSNMTYVSSSGAGWSCSSAANSGGTLVTCDLLGGSIAASGGTSVLQVTARPTNHLTVTNYAAVDPIGSISPPTPTTCTAANTPAGCAAPVVSPVPVTITGYGYEDINHNSARDNGEVGRAILGNALYVKLTARTGSVCSFPALAVATINDSSTLGNYSFANVAQGDYCLLLQLDNSLTSNNPGYPLTFIGTENPTGVIQFTVSSGQLPPQNFGLYRGSRLAGTVFADNGAGGGIANNGVRAGSEVGLAGITVILRRLGVELDRAVSAGDGSFLLWLPAANSAAGTVTTVLPDGYTATGGSAGTLQGGSYTRPGVNFSTALGRNDSGIAFGMVAPNTLAPNGVQAAQPGTAVYYAHTYIAATGGQVAFTVANAASPANPAWSQVLYSDSNCSATLEAGEPQATAAITVTAGQKVCLIVKQFVPANAGVGAQNSVTLSAAFNYTDATPALSISTLSAIDVTTVGEAGDLRLGKQVGNITQAIASATSVPARPGDTLLYVLRATNNGTKPLSTLVVSDFTPAFTSFVSAGCSGTLPAGITGCSVTTQPAAGVQGALQWTFTGALAPGAQVVVNYFVKVDQ